MFEKVCEQQYVPQSYTATLSITLCNLPVHSCACDVCQSFANSPITRAFLSQHALLSPQVEAVMPFLIAFGRLDIIVLTSGRDCNTISSLSLGSDGGARLRSSKAAGPSKNLINKMLPWPATGSTVACMSAALSKAPNAPLFSRDILNPESSLSALTGRMKGKLAPLCVSVAAHWYIYPLKPGTDTELGSLAVPSCKWGSLATRSAAAATMTTDRDGLCCAAATNWRRHDTEPSMPLHREFIRAVRQAIALWVDSSKQVLVGGLVITSI